MQIKVGESDRCEDGAGMTSKLRQRNSGEPESALDRPGAETPQGHRSVRRLRLEAGPRLKFAVLLLVIGGCVTMRWSIPAQDAARTGAVAVGPSTAAAPTALPKLPVVARPEAARPSVGVPTDTHLDCTPPRQTKGLDLVKMGWTYNCMECHKLIQAKWHYDRPMVEHENLKLEHGENRFCLNCHHPTNRNAFVDYDGSEIAEENVFLLCAKCHGPIYRDWKAGVHGRRNGYWDTAKGPQTQLKCIQCHDPHRPRFQPMKPLPPLRYPSRAPHALDTHRAATPTHSSAP